MEHSLHIEAVGGAGLVVGAPLEVGGQLARAAVVDHARVVLTDAICRGRETKVRSWGRIRRRNKLT